MAKLDGYEKPQGSYHTNKLCVGVIWENIPKNKTKKSETCRCNWSFFLFFYFFYLFIFLKLLSFLGELMIHL